MALVTFKPRGVVQIKINKFSPREVLLFQMKRACSTQCTSSQNGLLPLPVPWGHTGLHCLPLLKKNKNLLTNINAGASIASQMAIPISCSNNRRISMLILEEKEVFCLKIRLDLPHEMLKQIARSVKMNIFAPRHCERKPFHLITA